MFVIQYIGEETLNLKEKNMRNILGDDMNQNNIICFYHENEAFGCFSNWYMIKFEYAGKTYNSVEQYMMYQKAVTFRDYDVAKDIMETDDVAEIKALGRKVKNYSDVIWNGMRQIVIYQGLFAKFQQNAILKQQLLETGDSIIAECAVRDTIWGIGLSMKDTKRFDINEWQGTNLLGFALMAVRKELKNTQEL